MSDSSFTSPALKQLHRWRSMLCSWVCLSVAGLVLFSPFFAVHPVYKVSAAADGIALGSAALIVLGLMRVWRPEGAQPAACPLLRGLQKRSLACVVVGAAGSGWEAACWQAACWQAARWQWLAACQHRGCSPHCCCG